MGADFPLPTCGATSAISWKQRCHCYSPPRSHRTWRTKPRRSLSHRRGIRERAWTSDPVSTRWLSAQADHGARRGENPHETEYAKPTGIREWLMVATSCAHRRSHSDRRRTPLDRTTTTGMILRAFPWSGHLHRWSTWFHRRRGHVHQRFTATHIVGVEHDRSIRRSLASPVEGVQDGRPRVPAQRTRRCSVSRRPRSHRQLRERSRRTGDPVGG